MRVLVCGGRHWEDGRAVLDALDAIHAATPIVAIIEGGGTGADDYAEEWAALRGVTCETFEADWKAHGRAAGPIRNRRMLVDGRPDLVLAFPGGRGTADMVRQASAAGVRVVEAPALGGDME